MNKFIFFMLSLFLICSASVALADSRLLTCSNHFGSVVFQICGIKGCPTTVKVGTKSTLYNLKRVKNSDGSLSYSARAGSHPSCNIEISALRSGIRTAKSVSCATKLANSNCVFKDPGSSPAATPTPAVP